MMPDPHFPISENGTKYRIVFLDGDLRFDSRDPDDYQCDLAKCDRPAVWRSNDGWQQYCEVHQPWPVEAQ